MDLLIVIKWLASASATAPSIINTMIAMVLSLGGVDGTSFYDAQATVQLVLVIIAMVCVPWMWLPHVLSALATKPKHCKPSRLHKISN
jgi:V-type H+-transporting ATPase subunit a